MNWFAVISQSEILFKKFANIVTVTLKLISQPCPLSVAPMQLQKLVSRFYLAGFIFKVGN